VRSGTCRSCSSSAPCARCTRLADAWGQRADLFRVARARTTCRADAEDAVSEAFVRAAARQVDDDPLGGWLNVVTQNAARRRARDRARAVRPHQTYLRQQSAAVAGPEEEVCERLFAASVADLATGLPDRQRHALRLKAEGLDVSANRRGDG
jgi:RNA polymerase sigma factor (sigma-70 family)